MFATLQRPLVTVLASAALALFAASERAQAQGQCARHQGGSRTTPSFTGSGGPQFPFTNRSQQPQFPLQVQFPGQTPSTPFQQFPGQTPSNPLTFPGQTPSNPLQVPGSPTQTTTLYPVRVPQTSFQQPQFPLQQQQTPSNPFQLQQQTPVNLVQQQQTPSNPFQLQQQTPQNPFQQQQQTPLTGLQQQQQTALLTGLQQLQTCVQTGLQQLQANSTNMNAITFLQQQNVLQNILQQVNTLASSTQNALQQQNGQLTAAQMQTVYQQEMALWQQFRSSMQVASGG